MATHLRALILVALLAPTAKWSPKPVVLEALNSALGRAFSDDVPTVLDFWRSVADNGFVDLAHLTTQGRAEFSHLLALALRRSFPEGDAQMNKAVTRAHPLPWM